MKLEIGTVLYKKKHWCGKVDLSRFIVNRHTPTQAVAALCDNSHTLIARLPINVRDPSRFNEIGAGSGMACFSVATPELDDQYDQQRISGKLANFDFKSLCIEQLRGIERIVGGCHE